MNIQAKTSEQILKEAKPQIIDFMDVDSYKITQWRQYPKGMTDAVSYLEARGGGERVKFFGLQYILKNMNVPTVEQVEIAKALADYHLSQGVDRRMFNFDGWMEVAKLGYFPLRIKAVKEGTVVPTKQVLFTIENTLPGFGWLVGWFETQLMRVWYPTNVATISYEIKQTIAKYLSMTSGLDNIGQKFAINFKLHDFGGRGASVREAAGVGGMAHLTNFYGTDTFVAIMYAWVFYGELPRAYSIAASEHSTITSWGRDFEIDAFRNMIEEFGGEGQIYACVSDSYDIMAALDKWYQLWPVILKKGGTLVIRPDSGDPVATPVAVIERAMELFGHKTVNGFKVLPDQIRVTQGDGIDHAIIEEILETLYQKGISADNIAFGMGGALLQKHNRDTFKIAIKLSAALVNGEWRDVYKDPITDKGKASKKGRLTLVEGENGPETVRIEDINGRKELLDVVYEDSKLVKEYTFAEVAGYDEND